MKYSRTPLVRGVFEINFPFEVRDGFLRVLNSFKPDYFSSSAYRAIVQSRREKIGLTGVGALIWLILEEPHTAAELALILAEIFPQVSREILFQDALHFLEEMTSLGFISCEGTAIEGVDR